MATTQPSLRTWNSSKEQTTTQIGCFWFENSWYDSGMRYASPCDRFTDFSTVKRPKLTEKASLA